MIVQALAIEVQAGREAILTVSEIAHKLGVTPSTKLRIILAEMVVDQVLVMEREEHPGIAGFRRLYRLHGHSALEALRTAKSSTFGSPRKIKFNSRQGSFLADAK